MSFYSSPEAFKWNLTGSWYPCLLFASLFINLWYKIEPQEGCSAGWRQVTVRSAQGSTWLWLCFHIYAPLVLFDFQCSQLIGDLFSVQDKKEQNRVGEEEEEEEELATLIISRESHTVLCPRTEPTFSLCCYMLIHKQYVQGLYHYKQEWRGTG